MELIILGGGILVVICVVYGVLRTVLLLEALLALQRKQYETLQEQSATLSDISERVLDIRFYNQR